MIAEEEAYKPGIHALLLKCRRELCTKLDDVTDAVPVVANYFDKLMDEIVPSPKTSITELKGQRLRGRGE